MSTEDACGCTTLVDMNCLRCPNKQVYPAWFPTYDRAADEASVDAKNAAEVEKYNRDLDDYMSLTPRQQKKKSMPLKPGSPTDYWGYTKSYRVFVYDTRHGLDPAYDPEHMMFKCSACGYEWRTAV